MSDQLMPRRVCLVALAAALVALAGAYWDDGWHTERGRDAFLIPPHVAVYGGIALAGAVLAIWGIRAIHARGVGALRGRPPVALGLGAVALTLAAGPIDNAWHLAFGRDAVIWSAPHLLGIVGSLGIATSLLLAAHEAGSKLLAFFAGGGVLAACSLVVMEYDTDVPQFSTAWYLPVLGVATAVGFRIVSASGPPRRWGVTEAALAHLALVGAVAVLLAWQAFPAPALPVLVLPALAADSARVRSWPPGVRAGVLGLTLAVAAWVARTASAGGIELTVGNVVLGALATAIAAWLLDPAHRGPAGRTTTAMTAVALAVGVTALHGAQPAAAHDPGQGADAGSVAMRLRATGRTITLSAGLRPPCDVWTAVAVVARRAGRGVRAPLTRSACAASGRLEVPDEGRWFVYAELRTHGQPIEAWLPIVVGPDRKTVVELRRYAYIPSERASTPLQGIVAALLYAVAAGSLIVILRSASASRTYGT